MRSSRFCVNFILGAWLSANANLLWADDLLALYRDALTSNPKYLAMRADSAAQREALPQARAQLLPNLSMNGAKSKRETEQTSMSFGRPVTSERDYYSYNYALALRQPLFRPYNFALYAQAKKQVASADASQEQALQDVAVTVGGAYFDVLLAQSEVMLNLAQQEAYKAQMEFAEKAFRAGRGTRTDIDEAISRLDLTRAQAIELGYRQEQALDALSKVVGRPLQPLSQLDPERVDLVAPDPVRLADWVQAAEEVNPQLRALRANVEAAEMEVWKARAGHLPTVDLIAQRSRSDSDSDTSIGSKYDTKMLGVQVSIPLFAGGQVNSQVRQAQARLEKERQMLEGARRDVALQVRKEFDAASQGVHWVKAYEQAVRSAEQTLHSTRKGFQAGTRGNLDILNAEQNLATAKRDLNRGRYQYVLARLKLLALVGRLDDENMAHFNAWLQGGKAVLSAETVADGA